MFLTTFKERCAGFVLMTAIVPMALLGYGLIVCVGFLGKTDRARAGVRALDHFVNATLFNPSFSKPYPDSSFLPFFRSRKIISRSKSTL